MDFHDVESIRRVVRSVHPDVIVNAAAYTAVDRAESEPEAAMRVNAHAVEVLGAEAKRIGAAVIHYSTDYVFDGAKRESYVETDETNPLNVYGRSKLAGEQALMASGVPFIILRTSWVYAPHGKNFLVTMLRLAEERSKSGVPLKIVDDQFGAPTAARDLAEATRALLAFFGASADAVREGFARDAGVYHAAAQGQTNWYEFACAILRETGSAVRVVPIPTSEYLTAAARPRNSLLHCGKLARAFRNGSVGVVLPTWERGLRQTLDELRRAA